MGLLGIGGGLRIQKDKTKNKLGKNVNRKPGVPLFGPGGTPSAQGGNQNSFAASATNAGLVSTVAMSHTQGMELINPNLLK